MLPEIVAHSPALTSDAILVSIFVDADSVGWTCPPEINEAVQHAVTSMGLEPKPESVHKIPAPAGSGFSTIYLVGTDRSLGSVGLRNAAAAGVRQVTKATRLDIAFPIDTPEEAAAVCEGALLGAHSTAHRKTAPTPAGIETLTVRGADERTILDAHITASAVSAVRDLVAEVPNHQSPAVLAEHVRAVAESEGLTVTVLDEAELVERGFGGISAVGAGSVNPPRYVEITYAPTKATRRIELVGKGITFDSGGLSLKPAASMVGMKYDMTGAATVFATIIAAHRLALPIAVTARLCIAENMPSGTASRPGDVITMLGGTTVEITNTDAEGRLVLADGLVAASATSPDAIIDVATLTGAARVALGDRIVGVMGNGFIVDEIADAARSAGEETWAMPLPEYLGQILSSDVADLANAKPGNTAAGMLVGGYFLQQFVGTDAEGVRIPWAHLDIAGPANNPGSPYGVTPKGPTGTMVRTLLTTLRNLSAQVGNKE
ncbi:MAG: hypothetical protein RL431_1047 [Actinomycetota bacterium]|jgi:leucyl aminopeptidase